MYINWNEKQLKILNSYDCCVIGGGTAGAFAGIESAKNGLNTIIIEKMTSLGGTQVSALVSPTMPSYVHNLELCQEMEQRMLDKGVAVFAKEYEETLANATIERPRSTPTLKWTESDMLPIVLEEMLFDYNGNVLYDVNLIDVIASNGQITHLVLFGTEGLFALETKTVIDASGDAVVARMLNLEVLKGNENGENQFTSIRFEVGGVDIEKMYDFFTTELTNKPAATSLPHFHFLVTHQGREEALKPLFDQALADGVITKLEYAWIQGFTIVSKPGCLTFNCPRIPGKTDILDPYFRSSSYSLGRTMIQRYIKFLQIYVKGFENCYLNKVATQIGVRESYRIKGKYILNFEDYLAKQKFDDGVVQADYWIDIHNDIDQHDEEDEFAYNYKEYYEVPYRSMVCDGISNLIFAGRNISCDFHTHSSVRIQPQCRYMGIVAGYAAKLSLESNVALNEVDGSIIKKHFYDN